MSLRIEELFCDVASCRSFSKAAEVNGISQSSVSQAVAQLEKRLGVELLDRTKRPLEMTSAGERYFTGCQRLIEEFRELEDDLQQLASKVTGRLRIAAIYSVGLPQMDRYVQYYQSQFPDVEFRMNYCHPEEVCERVRNGIADLGLISFPRESGELSSIPWQEQPIVLVVHPAHRLAMMAGTPVPVRELDDEPLVSFTPELPIRRQLDRWLREARVQPQIVHEFDNIEQVRRAVEDGVGVALLPTPTVARGVATGTLVSLELANTNWRRPLGIIHRRHRIPGAAASRFIELLHENPDMLPRSDQPRRNGQRGAKRRGARGRAEAREAEHSPSVQ